MDIRRMERFWNKVDVAGLDECWVWTAGKFKGREYGKFKDGNKSRKAHRVAWEVTNNKAIPEGLLVCHRCDNPACCNPRHLYVGTHRDNATDMVAKGRHNSQSGERNGNETLSWQDVVKIRCDDRTAKEISIERNMSHNYVMSVKRGSIRAFEDGSIEKMTEEVVRWIHKKLPNRNPFDTAIKLVEETGELLHALHTGDGSAGAELADCLILILDLAFLLEVDLKRELLQKMEVNKNRTWIKVMGTLKHE